jgi:hypothetical protein
MLPNFLIVGAQKAATTWLATCLREHPGVFIPQHEEIYYFNTQFDRGLEWYESHFSDWSGQAAVGEATPGYLSNPDAPGRIRATLGDVKLIANVRHPVDRAYSAFWHHLRNGQIPPDADFRTLFRQDDQLGIRSRGFYSVQLNRYLEHFAPENLLVLIYEEIFRDGQQTINNCLKYLAVDPQFEPQALDARVNRGGRDISAFHSQARRLRGASGSALRRLTDTRLFPRALREPLFALGRRAFEKLAFEGRAKKRHFERLDAGLRQELLGDYRADITQLEDLLGRDLSIWYEPSRT